MFKARMREESNEPVGKSPGAKKSEVICKYLLNSNVSIYKELQNLKKLGWCSTTADEHFQKQREIADNAPRETQERFFRIMLDTAKELDLATGVFSIIPSDNIPSRVFDVCIAPGTYAEYILQKYPETIIDGLTLSPENGGYEVVLSNVDPETHKERNVNITFTDVTLHRAFLPVNTSIPTSYPDFSYLDSNPPLPSHLASPVPSSLYDLVICDGQRLRTYKHADLRYWEMTRLFCSQMILALTHLKPGGAMLILHHKPEDWRTLSTIYKLSLFSEIIMHKPPVTHATRSSFFIIAKNVRSDSQPAREFVEYMKDCWYRATFGGPEGRGEDVDTAEDLDVEMVLEEFGAKYVEMAKGVWERHRNGLKRARWIGNNGRRGRGFSYRR